MNPRNPRSSLSQSNLSGSCPYVSSAPNSPSASHSPSSPHFPLSPNTSQSSLSHDSSSSSLSSGQISPSGSAYNLAQMAGSSSLHPFSGSTNSGVVKGKLQKKSLWTGWADAYFQVTDGGLLFEFKHESSSKPVRVRQLNVCTVQLAENLTGKPFSFVIASPKSEDIYLRANDETALVEWVSAIGSHCPMASVDWGTDSFIEALVDSVVVSSEDGTIISVNQKACEMFGYEKYEMMGRNVDILTPPHIAQHHAAYMTAYVQTGEKRLIGKPRNLPLQHRNGETFRGILSLGEQIGADGVRKFIGTMRSETSLSQAKIQETIFSSVDISIDSLGKTIKDALVQQMAAVFETMEQLSAKNKQLQTQLAIEKEAKPITRSEDLFQINLQNLVLHEKLAATGGSGATVFSCTVDGFRCAMKELRLDDTIASSLDSFSAEILLLEKIPFHKNVVRYLFHTKTETHLRLFMAQYTGTLSRLINKKANEAGTFTQAEVARFMIDMINGLEALHRLNIIHRDLKSDNIFYTQDPNGNVANLAIGDLDTAKALSHISTSTTTVVGTPGYMAPEILLGQKYSNQVDVWSLGMIMYELMMLQRPYSNASIFLLAQLVVKGELPEISESVRLRFPDLIPIWNNCVKTDPLARPNLESVRNALHRFCP